MVRINLKVTLMLFVLINCFIISCCPNIFSPQYKHIDPFAASDRVKISRLCKIDSMVCFNNRYLSVVNKLNKINSCKDITNIPNDTDTYSRLAELALVAEYPGAKCGGHFFPIIVKSNKPLNASYLYGGRVYLVHNNEYLKAFSDFGFRKNLITINIVKYNWINNLFDNFVFQCKRFEKSSQPHPKFIIKYDRYDKFACGEERRQYWYYSEKIGNEFKIVYYRFVGGFNSCCSQPPFELPDTSITNKEWREHANE